MLLTKERDYAMRVVWALCDMKQHTVKDICDKEFVPLDFAYKILKKLEHNGITRSTRGRNGGYSLAKPPSKISMLDVLLAIDSRLFISDDVEGRSNKNRKRCRISEEFGMLQGSWVDSLRERTLDKLA